MTSAAPMIRATAEMDSLSHSDLDAALARKPFSA